MQVFQNVCFLYGQRIALHGDGKEKDSNFIQLLLLCSIDNPQSCPCSIRRQINILAPLFKTKCSKSWVQVLREIADSFQKAKFFSLMADEVSDYQTENKLLFVYAGLTLTSNLMKSSLLYTKLTQ